MSSLVKSVLPVSPSAGAMPSAKWWHVQPSSPQTASLRAALWAARLLDEKPTSSLLVPVLSQNVTAA